MSSNTDNPPTHPPDHLPETAPSPNESLLQTQREWREYMSGGGAAIVAITLTFPINKTMFRQQVHHIPASEAVKQLYREGSINLYRGVLSPLLMKFLSQSVMFGSYSQYSRLLKEKGRFSGHQSKVFGALMAGVSEAMLMPLERVQVLMQDQKNYKKFRNTPHALYALRSLGVTEYYRGFSAILIRNCPGNVIFFTVREQIRDNFLSERWKSDPYASNISNFLCGAFLGAFISTMFYPVNVTKTHMQLVVGGPFQRFRSVFKKLLAERGVRGMFRGVHINYTRSFLSWGIINVTYENLLKLLKNW